MTKNYRIKSRLKFSLWILVICFSFNMKAQLSGTVTIPGIYATLANAIADINLQGVNGPLVVNITAGYTETAPVGGFSLTATGTLANTITFQKSGAGANPLLTAYATGTATPGSAVQDGVFKLIGSDYITIDGIDINDPNAANPATMEYGYALYKASTSNGCQNNTIKNCVITLNRINNAAGTSPMVDGSTGIIVMNSTASAATTVLTATTAAGSNSNNKFYTNTIQNCNIGIALIGYAAPTPFTAADFGNDIGGSSATTGNTIINFGGGAITNPSAGIRTLAQYGINVSYNTINNNNGAGVNHATTLRGIYLNTATSANVSITNNKVTVNSGGTTSLLSAIENASGSTAASNTVLIANNVITNCTYTTATSGTFNGILNSSTPAVTTVSNNIISNSIIGASGVASSCIFVGIYTSGSTGTNPVSIVTNTVINNIINNQGGTMYCLRGTTSAITVNGNVVNNNRFPLNGGTLAAVIYGYYNFGSPTIENYTNNRIDNLTISGNSTSVGSSIIGLHSNTTGSTALNASGNIIHTLTYNNSSSGSATVYGINYFLGTIGVSKNKIYNTTANGANSTSAGIYISGGTTINLSNNIIGDIKTPSASGLTPANGIYLGGGTTVNAYYNTVYLAATSTGTLFGNSAIYANTTTNLDLRNNIFVNASAQTGTGTAVAYRRASTTIASYVTSSNNNLFYAGTPTPKNLIFSDGTNDYITLPSYQTAMVNRDQASVTENPPFLSTTGSAANYLHINPATVTTIEGGAANIATYTDDYDGDIRQGNAGYVGTGTSPDIGADEFNGISPAPSINALAITPSGNKCVAVGRVVTATVTPGSTNLTSITLNYSFNGVAQPAVAMTGGSLSSASSWTGNIPVAVPSNANVAWYVSVTDGTYTKTSNGTSYKDEPLLGVIAQATSSLSTICAGSSSTLIPSFGNATSAAISALPPAVSNPTTDEDLGNIIFGTLTNTTSINSLVGSIGTANGVAGSYSDFTAFGPYAFTAGTTYSLSLTSLQAATPFGNAFGVYIDYNRNGIFTDAGEAVYVSTVTTLGTHTETTSITIPASAKNGLTRMRVVVNEGLVTGSAMTVAYGEYEEYMLNISSANQGGGSVPTFTAYAWNDGTSTVATTSVAALSPTTSTTYSVIATDINGCSVTSSPVTVSVVPIPSIPTVTNTAQCGVAASSSAVGGGTSYNWYSTNTSTLVLQSGATSTYTTPISSTSTFYVASDNGVCLSPRAAVTTSVSLPDPVFASTSATAICPGNSVLLSSTQGTVNVYTFTWTATPASGSGIPTSIAGNTVNVTPTAPGTYVYQVYATDGICSTTASVTVVLNNSPSIIATANPNVICSTGSVNLNAQSINGAPTSTVGSGATSGTTYDAVFYHLYGGNKTQHIIRASELLASGLSAGSITNLSINIPSGGGTYAGLAVSIATTSNVDMSAGLNNTASFNTIYNNSNYTTLSGINSFNFNTPYYWDGLSNIIVQFCWSNNNTGGTSNYASVITTSYVSTAYYRADNQTVSAICGGTVGTGTTSKRPLFVFSGGNVTSSMNFVWNPGAINTNTAVVNPVNTGTAGAIQDYTVSATDPVTTCSNTAVVAVLVNPLPSSPTAVNSTQCGVGIPTASVSGGTSYNWYATATSTVVLQAGTSSTFTTAINSTTDWFVSSYNGTCESQRVKLTTSVTIPDAITASISSASVCPNSLVTLMAANTGTTNMYTYSWTASPASGSGISAPIAGSSISVTPTSFGNYIYTVTGTDGACTTTNTIALNVFKTMTLTPIAMATPNPICAGNTLTLSAAFGTTATPVYTAPPTVSSPTVDEDLGNITFGSLNNTSAINSLVGSIGTAVGTAGGYSDFSAFGPYPFSIGNTYSLSLSSLQATTAYGNSFGVYIDYNRNGIFTDVGEAIYVSTSTTLGAHTETANITIPSSATPGKTKMRVVVNEGSVTSPTMAVSWGEYEEYSLNLTTTLTFNWLDGSTSVGTTNPLAIVSSSATTSYSFVATDANACVINSTPVTVTVNPLPTIPTVANSIQCGLAVPTASVSGGTSYNWYATPTSTTILQAGTSDSYTTAINNSTTFYVSSFNGTCESVRAALTVTVNTPDNITASTNSSLACPGSSILLSSTQGSVNVYVFTWSATPSAGSGISTTVAGNTVNVTPTTPGTYVYQVYGTDGICSTTSTVSVTLNDVPNITNPSATPSIVCSGSNVNLQATSIISGPVTLPSYTCTPSSSGSACLTLVSINTLTRASVCEAGNYIDVPSSSVTTNLTPGQTYTLSLTTNASAITSVWFDWNRDGVFTASEWLQPFVSGTTGTVSVLVPILANGGQTKMRVRSRLSGNTNGSSDACSSFGSGEAEDYSINIQTDNSASYNWVWNLGAINTNTAIVNPTNTGTTAVTQVYTVSVTNPTTTCVNTATVGVLVNPLPVAPTVANSTQCGVGIPTASVSGGTIYNWYNAATSGTLVQTGTGSTYTSSISNTTNYYVSSYNGTCESTRSMITASVTIPDAVTASLGSASVCPNTTVSLLATNTGTTNTYSYTWTGSPVAGSGIATSVAGTSVIVTPTLPGNYIYTVAATDGVCNAIATTTLNVFQALTTPPIASGSPNPVCAGSSTVVLSASFGSTVVPTYTTPPSVGAPTTDEDFGNITFGSLNNTSTYNSLSGSIGTAAGTAGDYSDFTAFGPYTYNLGSTYTLSLSSLQGTSAYGNGFGVYIDYNKNGVFTDAGEAVYVSTVTVAGAHTETASITIPSTATPGITRLRVIVNEGLVTGPTMPITWGEYEEYKLNLTPNVTYNWTDGSTSVGTASTLTLSPSTTTTYSFSVTDGNSCSINSAPVTITVNPLPVINASTPSSTICANSSATLSATGATTYTWAPTGGNAATAVVTPSANTTYTVTGSLLGCISTNTVSLATTPSPTLNVVASATSAICAGTTATLTTSGTATSFTWTPAVSTTSMAVVTPTANATYTVVGFDAGCTTTKTISLAVTANPTVNLVATNTVICIGSTTSSTINATGTATSFTWTPAVSTTSTAVVSPTSTASYTVVGLASGCTTTKTITVNVANTPTVTAIAPNNVICAGSTATLTSTGNATSYTWSPVGGNGASAVVTPTTATTYTLIGEASGCTNSSVVTLTVSALPTVTATSSSSAICTGESAVLTASSSATSYTWSNTANTVSTTITPTITSNYTVTVSNGTCTANATVSVTVNACIGIEELSSNGISIYPNPTIDKLNIAINADLVSITSVSIYDALGKLVITEKLNTELTTIRTSNLDSGVYFVKITSNNREIKIGKLVKQ
jgi:hypothetical protein